MSTARAFERLVLAAVLAALALLPVLEMAMRAVFSTGISGAAAFTQHLALAAGMLGAAVAAGEGRLLSLSTLASLLAGGWARAVRWFSGTVAGAVAALLCLASLQFVLAERAGGNVIAYGVPVWLAQSVLPLGFALTALRLAWSAAVRWPARVASAGLCAFALAAAWTLPLDHTFATLAVAAVLVATLLGAPVFATVGGVALLLFWSDGVPIAALAVDHYRLAVNPSLPMIPLFTLAGYFLAEGGAPRRLLRVFDALFGGLRGGAAVVVVLACTFFTSFSGASGVTIIALGGILLPLLLGAGYTRRDATGLLVGSGSLGGLFPPGLPLVLYAIVAGVAIEQMFLAGLLPGLLVVTLVALWGRSRAPRGVSARRRFDPREARAALLAAKWELLLPVVAFTGLFGGFATPVEAAAITAVYAFVVQTLVHRDLDLRRDVPRVMGECGLLVGGVLLILGVALGFTNYLTDARVPERAVDWATNAIESRWLFLAALNLCLLVAGCLLDVFSATAVLVPLVLPMALAFGIDPLHLGIIFLVNMELGYLTPPVGMNLFFAAYRFNRPLPEMFRAALPAAGILAVAVLLVSAAPFLATGLPRLLGG